MIRAALALASVAALVFAGTAPEADLSAPIPLCEEIELALDLPTDAFDGLHPDAFAQFKAMVADLCRPPDDARSWAILRAWADGPDVPPAPVPLPQTGWMLMAALAALALRRA
jgi:hypothetical protein